MKNYIFLIFYVASITATAQNATVESNAIKLKRIQERAKQLEIQKISDSLDKIEKSQYGDVTKANQNPDNVVWNERFSQTAAAGGRDLHIPGEAPAKDMDEIHESWLGKNQNLVIGGAIMLVILYSIANRKANS